MYQDLAIIIYQLNLIRRILEYYLLIIREFLLGILI